MRASTFSVVRNRLGVIIALSMTVVACQPIARSPITQLPAATPTTPAAVVTAATAPAPINTKAFPTAGKTVQTDDIVTYYEEYGQGEPVLLLPGGDGSSVEFANVIPELSKEFKMYALDTRGRGRTTDSIKPLSYDLMMSDTLKFMDTLGIRKAHIVGWSDGAIIGLDMSIHHPDRVLSLVSYGGNYDLQGQKPFVFDFLKTATIEDRKDWADAYRAVSPHPERFELMFEKVRTMQLTQPNMTPDQLKTIPIPVLILDGEDEEFIVIDQTREMAQLIPNAELKLMQGVGHFAPLEKPKEFNSIVLQFLRRQVGKPK